MKSTRNPRPASILKKANLENLSNQSLKRKLNLIIKCKFEFFSSIDVLIEDRLNHQGSLKIRVKPTTTLSELKQLLLKRYQFPTDNQRWFMGRRLATDDQLSLNDYEISATNCSLFLYIVAAGIYNLKKKKNYYLM